MVESIPHGLAREVRALQFALGVRAYSRPIWQRNFYVVIIFLFSPRFHKLKLNVSHVKHSAKVQLGIGALDNTLTHSLDTIVEALNVLQIAQQLAKSTILNDWV